MKVMLAKKYKGQDVQGWFMSEKLDGVRAVWNGENFVSRNGNIFHAPDWFKKDLPKDVTLDGELWMGRGCFQKTVGKIRAGAGDWETITYQIFDVVSDGNFEERLAQLERLDLPVHCQIVTQKTAYDSETLEEFEREILEIGGEGVMLRDRFSSYEQKRSSNLLKLKRFDSDEAVVIGHEPGKGKYLNGLGALICKWKGKTFKIGAGLSDYLREFPPMIGSVVTFTFFATTDCGIPRHSCFVAARNYE